jgi:hypothetical protein
MVYVGKQRQILFWLLLCVCVGLSAEAELQLGLMNARWNVSMATVRV